ncbi:MAG: molybdopterin-dependent oxidoreductase [Bdellovibrionales bacterium]|jgi:DMSO reductase family type II enzyme molybdopterin subunit|nr:molybdopterin-dependent oxidoreductase [Bdellovibrionales bacterium]MBT3525352.1 molybdopterin-dependent oxidoreductase [Bdellovibrionales bacterium]MBT7765508.1 molybdopterin-dependent oxidoreductase [Bdellovibrionales bacterium]
MPVSFTRRDTLKGLLTLGVGSLATTLKARTLGDDVKIVEDPRYEYSNASYTEKFYRQEFSSSYGVKSEHGHAYHCVNCQGNCAWEVWVKDGKVTRENQSRSYPAINPKIPDFNPRGCNKGVQHSQTMYEEDRLLHPMKRIGKRGDGKWQRISWDDAITEVASNLYQTMRRVGPAGNYIHIGAGMITEGRAASFKRLGTLLGAVRPYIASYVGDMFPGVSLVYGEGNIGCTSDFFYQSNLNIFWGTNPNTTRIPDAHFIWEGKYNGAKTIVITPEYNSSCIHADLWIPIKPGSDAYLALSVMDEIVERKLYNPKFIKEFTDLPLLVRKDSNALLTLADIDPKNALFDDKLLEHFSELMEEEAEHHPVNPSEIFLALNKSNGKVTIMSGSRGMPVETLRLVDSGWKIDPDLDADLKLTLKDGKEVEVTTSFNLLKQQLTQFSAKRVEGITGVNPSLVKELAQDMIYSKVAMTTIGFSLGKYFNGMLTQRAISSLVALTGKMGDLGGLNTENEWSIEGLGTLSSFAGKYRHRFASGAVSEFMLGESMDDYQELFSDSDLERATGMDKDDYQQKVEALVAKAKGDQGVGEGKSYWEEVETFVMAADARFRRNKGSYKEAFLNRAKFFAYADFRVSDLAQYADILLPAKSHYEVWDIRVNPGYHRYANLAHPPKGLNQVGEAKSEWEMATLIAKKITQLAKEQYKKSGDKRDLHIADPTHSDTGFRELELVADLFTIKGELESDRDAVEMAVSNVKQFRPHNVKSMIKQGGHLQLNDKAGKSSPLGRDRPYNTFENNLYLHQPMETLTGRLTFYVDDPEWIKVGAHLPIAVPELRAEKFPLLLMTPHAKWSIHSTYKTSTTLQRLQRGVPYAMIGVGCASRAGVKDGEMIKLVNSIGSVEVMAKVTPNIPNTVVLMEHGWEPYMFKGGVGQNQIMADMLNLLELSDGWGHLKFGVNWDGNQHAYTTTVKIEKV